MRRHRGSGCSKFSAASRCRVARQAVLLFAAHAGTQLLRRTLHETPSRLRFSPPPPLQHLLLSPAHVPSHPVSPLTSISARLRFATGKVAFAPPSPSPIRPSFLRRWRSSRPPAHALSVVFPSYKTAIQLPINIIPIHHLQMRSQSLSAGRAPANPPTRPLARRAHSVPDYQR
ncbi:hypothetical protein IWZ01DRAFT_250001 [Phyllosticta capitalensis]|uniref:Uncharacterized protein n=1 Tax=Phyllosticta capitalensis TaxID=121624 RepID=A0ABR1YRZ9_9PEZI